MTTFVRGTAARCVIAGLLLWSTRAGGQSSGARVSFAGWSLPRPELDAGAMGVGIVTHAAPAIFGESRTEGYLTQPSLLGQLRIGTFAMTGTLNLEGYTLRRGELNAGIYGEGYVDRRHPHTLVHEAMFSWATTDRRRWQLSIAAGKGFTPYGTDDPMMRPMVKFPVNHHHAQIIERVQTIAAVRLGPRGRAVTLEHAVFNGDEPIGPFTGPVWSRFGDSHATRLTFMPTTWIEAQASRAFVRSPGITQGGAFDHTQRSASLRLDRPGSSAHAAHEMSGGGSHMAASRADRRYVLLEVARTSEGFGSREVFQYQSLLAEAMATHRGWGVAVRAERTDRPESERLLDPFRVANGHIDFQIIGITRWSVGTVQLSAPPSSLPILRRAHLAPFVEIGAARGTSLRTPSVFVPREFYGANTLWSVTAGVRVHVGEMRARMGRYGVLDVRPLPTPPQ